MILIEVGRAGWSAAQPPYLALPHAERGTRVRICGTGGCVERRSTDVGVDGPNVIASLSWRDFQTVSGDAHLRDECVVTVEYLDMEDPAASQAVVPIEGDIAV